MPVLRHQERQVETCRLRAFAFLLCIKMFLWSHKNTLKFSVLFFCSHMCVFDPSPVTWVISDSSFSCPITCVSLCILLSFVQDFLILFNVFSCSCTAPNGYILQYTSIQNSRLTTGTAFQNFTQTTCLLRCLTVINKSLWLQQRCSLTVICADFSLFSCFIYLKSQFQQAMH